MKILFFPFILLFGLSACSKESTDLQIVNLEGEFIISASQGLSGQGPQFLLNISTVREQSCSASQIEYSLQSTESGRDIVIENILELEDCSTGKGIVSENIQLNSNQEKVDISVALRDIVKNKGQLNISDTEYLLSFNSLEGIFIGRQSVKRIPADLIFGSIEIGNQTHLNEILDILNPFSTHVLEDGDYALFQKIGNNITLISNQESEEVKNIYFRITDIDGFADALNDVRAQYPHNNISLLNAFGEWL